jgi:SPFH domain-Band 7 family
VGHVEPRHVRDQDLGIVRLRVFGTYDFRVTKVPLFLREVAGTDQHFRLDEFAETMRSRIVSVLSEALAEWVRKWRSVSPWRSRWSVPGPIGAGATALAEAKAIPELLTPADAAKALGVPEADVLASLESGDLKGTRIGPPWRVTRVQLAAFVK